MAQALALAVYELARDGRSSPDGAGIDRDAVPFAGSIGYDTRGMARGCREALLAMSADSEAAP